MKSVLIVLAGLMLCGFTHIAQAATSPTSRRTTTWPATAPTTQPATQPAELVQMAKDYSQRIAGVLPNGWSASVDRVDKNVVIVTRWRPVEWFARYPKSPTGDIAELRAKGYVHSDKYEIRLEIGLPITQSEISDIERRNKQATNDYCKSHPEYKDGAMDVPNDLKALLRPVPVFFEDCSAVVTTNIHDWEDAFCQPEDYAECDGVRSAVSSIRSAKAGRSSEFPFAPRPKDIQWGPEIDGLQMALWTDGGDVIFGAIRNVSDHDILVDDFPIGYWEAMTVEARLQGQKDWKKTKWNGYAVYAWSGIFPYYYMLAPGKEIPYSNHRGWNDIHNADVDFSFMLYGRLEWPAELKGNVEVRFTQKLTLNRGMPTNVWKSWLVSEPILLTSVDDLRRPPQIANTVDVPAASAPASQGVTQPATRAANAHLARYYAWPEISRLVKKIQATAEGSQREALLATVAKRLPIWYASMDVQPPDTTKQDWLDVVIWDFMPHEVVEQALGQYANRLREGGMSLPEKITRRELWAAMHDLDARAGQHKTATQPATAPATQPATQPAERYFTTMGPGDELCNAKQEIAITAELAQKMFVAQGDHLASGWEKLLPLNIMPAADAMKLPDISEIHGQPPRSTAPYAHVAGFSDKHLLVRISRQGGSYLWHHFEDNIAALVVPRTNALDASFDLAMLERQFAVEYRGLHQGDSYKKITATLGQPERVESTQSVEFSRLFYAGGTVQIDIWQERVWRIIVDLESQAATQPSARK